MAEGLEEGVSVEAGDVEGGGVVEVIDADKNGDGGKVITMIQESFDVAATGMLLCILSNFEIVQHSAGDVTVFGSSGSYLGRRF